MLDAHSDNLAVTANANIVFNNVTVETGSPTYKPINISSSKDTVYLNRPGIYFVSVHASGSTTADGTIAMQLLGDDKILTSTSSYKSAGNPASISFSKLVPVDPAAFTSRAKLQVKYTGGAGTLNTVGISVIKVA